MTVKAISEKEFMGQVIDLAHLRGWIIAHFRPSQTQSGRWVTAVQADGEGFPDLFMLRPDRRQSVAAELKVGRGRTSAEQERWLDAMDQCGIAAYVWRPEDWAEIERVLEHGPDTSGE